MEDSEELIFSERLIALGIQAGNPSDVISQLGELLFKEGYTKDTFIDNAIEREKEFATGLPMGRINVALPHTDAEHVLRSAIAVGVLKEPVEFHVMGSPDDTILVHLVFLMAVKNDQVKMLQVLCDTLQQPVFIDKLLHADTKKTAIGILESYFKTQD